MAIEDISDFNLNEYTNLGFQATNLSRGVEIIKEMKKQKATVFLTFTSNMVASGLRGIFKEMCKKKLVDCIITAGGSIDHDLIKCRIPYQMGDFVMDDSKLHKSGTNRIGNILVPNKAYEYLEEFIHPVFEELYQEDKITSPSKLIRKIGEKPNELIIKPLKKIITNSTNFNGFYHQKMERT
jgi:deoxyhypusine synthase